MEQPETAGRCFVSWWAGFAPKFQQPTVK